MKKIIVFLLSLALMLSFCGCLEQSDWDSRDDDHKESSNVSNDDTDRDDADDDEKSESDDKETSDEALSSKEFSMGEVSDTVYTSDFIGVRYNLNDGWTFSDEDQIKAFNNLAVELTEEEVEKLLKNAAIIYDMFAVGSNRINNINIYLNKIDSTELETLDMVDHFNAAIPALKELLGKSGHVNINCEIIKIEVDGKTVDALRTTAESSGVNMYQVLFAKKCNGYLATMGITTYVDDTTSDLLKNFEWID